MPGSAELNQFVFDNAEICITVFNENHKVIDCNNFALKYFGVKDKADFCRRFTDFLPEYQPNGKKSIDLIDEKLDDAFSKERIVFEWMYQTLDGTPLSSEITFFKIMRHHDVAVVAFTKDVGYLKQALISKELERSRLMSILNSSPVCFATLLEGKVAFVTPFMSNLLGIHIGEPIQPLFLEEGGFEKIIAHQNEGEGVVNWTPLRIQTKSGIIKEVLLYTFELESDEVTERGLWLIDVTQSRKIEEALRQAKEIAEASAKAKSEFLANMSHEIRTPMNAILGMTYLALRTKLNPQQTEYIEAAQQSAKLLLRIINDILDFSKIEAGRLMMEYHGFSITQCIDDLTTSLLDRVKAKKLTFTTDIDSSIPQNVMGDSVRFSQVVLNLFNNAVKFTEQGGITLKIDVAEQDVLSVVIRCSVQDTGIGMTPFQVQRLFQPFTQADSSSTRQFGGTGLGLAISKRIVELMHGEILCRSQFGIGTTFTFTARFGIPLEGEMVDADTDTASDAKVDALLVGNNDSLVVIRHYLDLFKSKTIDFCKSPAEFNRSLDAGQVDKADFIVFDFTDIQANLVPIFTMLKNHKTEHKVVYVFLDHPGLRDVLTEFDILEKVEVLQTPIIASELFNVLVKISTEKKQILKSLSVGAQKTGIHQGANALISDAIRGAKVLLAEDNKVNQMVAMELLRIEGFNVSVANNGKEAVDLLHQQHFDIVLMDIQMPEMDGFEAAKLIRSEPQFNNVPILAMTAHAMTGDRELSLEAGMNDHITKPIEPKILYAALAKWIQR
ncbi:hypothetical protein FACS189454_04930 [Planctomycetales bacterium]|nr:hypothetical protein FACS189454_04930 [Planctomycetales bacterium]